MRKKKVICAILLTLLVTVGAYTGVSAAAGSADPLVTLSYLTSKFTPQMEGEMKAMVDSRAAELTRQFNQALASAGTSTPAPTPTPGSGTSVTGTGASVFKVVTLKKGQTLTGDVGCEVMLRVGTASCAGSDAVGLIDESSAGTLAGGKALTKNHLYMVTISTRTVTATADTVKLLVRGPYYVK